MKRSEVLQGLLSLFAQPAYLEIGVSKGGTFKAITAIRKVAVDPLFKFDVAEWQQRMPEAEFHAVTSDEYFGSIVKPEERFDVIYLDGLHTSEQTLRDLLNSFSYLAEKGIIVIDDILPPNYAASLPSIEQFGRLRRAERLSNLQWMGDVYRLVPFIETFCQQWTYRCVADNHGQLVLWKSRRNTVRERTISAIGRFPYESARLNRKNFYFCSFSEILAEVRSACAPTEVAMDGD